jgi:hypothetical protein
MREAEREAERDRAAGIVLPTFPKGRDKEDDVVLYEPEADSDDEERKR